MRRLLALVLLLPLLALAQNNFTIQPATNSTFSSSIRPAPTYVDARVLAATVAETHTIPAGVRWVLFSSDCNFYAKPGASAAVPAADVTDGTASEQNPSAWLIASSTTQITLIAATACKVTLSFFR